MISYKVLIILAIVIDIVTNNSTNLGNSIRQAYNDDCIKYLNLLGFIHNDTFSNYCVAESMDLDDKKAPQSFNLKLKTVMDRVEKDFENMDENAVVKSDDIKDYITEFYENILNKGRNFYEKPLKTVEQFCKKYGNHHL
ncbi:uncharacterized protein LOC132930270 isoform X2 [Rhopalosiphum padi]|uniref:uncharacterized protein LOC132930270 isoform X2 n=1 Tax=Rhopalosiphum padi TaxID=40932 RepID=UPI00298EB0C7|nr:uncharacterized protein LOC132930270 isoform X2 [Rhopalosiphum padi]